TAQSIFGNASDYEFYINWKMDENNGLDGEIWKLFSSVTNPSSTIDTSSCTNIVPSSSSFGHFGNSSFSFYGSNYIASSINVYNSFTYAVEESSSVRVRLRIDSRKIERSGTADSLRMLSRWTLYPTGQFFRYDSLWNLTGVDGTIDHAQVSVYIRDQTYATPDDDGSSLRGGIINSQTYPDVITSWLSMRNNSGPASAFTTDYMTTYEDGNQSGLQYHQFTSAPTQWENEPVQTCYFIGMTADTLQTSSIASQSESVRNQSSAISMTTGTLTTNSTGDLNTDGFNETEGAYVMAASDNTVKFTINGGTVRRYYPAFRITNYLAANKPQYIFAFNNTDTVALVEGYQYNCYLNMIDHELVIQIDSILSANTGIFISDDKTLAVTLSNFEARAGNGCDTLIWRTESEQENLGYRLFRRVNPDFFDSVFYAYTKSDSADESADDLPGVPGLFKRGTLASKDTAWVAVNNRLVQGSTSGASYGPRDYQVIDHNVYNEVLYEYRLVAIDYHQNEEQFGPISVMPKYLFPTTFMLGRNYPNPFRYMTTIQFALPTETKVSLNIYTLKGQLVRQLITPDKKMPAMFHQVFWDGRNDQGTRVAAGPYIYRMKTGKFRKAKIMLMVR
ncbi:MAG: hypothetical protein OQK82_04335, partial [Candidatus Pacearchaeota archaeon]|nr:hypothetical protein [Candidatus Pacearchaeota archaeon]